MSVRKNPPSFVVIDSVTGRVGYTKRATGMGNEAIAACAARARELARRTGHSQIVFLELYKRTIGQTLNVGMVRSLGITEEVYPDGRVTRDNPRRVRRNIFTFNNPPSGPVDDVAARELEIYIENDARLYNSQFIPIVKNLMLKKRRGIYDREKAVKLFMYLMDAGARKYIDEFGTRGAKIDTVFNRNTRLLAARRFMEDFETEAHLGNYNGLIGPVSNPRRSSVRENIYVFNNPRKLNTIEQAASEAGLAIATWAPGDGSTRYRFFKAKPGGRGPWADYHQGDALYTAMGRKDAMSFIVAYQMGRHTRRNPSRAAQKFVSSEIGHLRRKGYPRARAAAAAYSMARKKGYRVNAARCNPGCMNPSHPHGAVENPYGRGRERRSYQEFLSRKRSEYGAQFDSSELDPRFVPYYENGKRIWVNDFGHVTSGTVGVTTGWRPVFLLISSSRAMGSSTTLTKKTKILGEVGVYKPRRGQYGEPIENPLLQTVFAANPPISAEWNRLSGRQKLELLELVGFPQDYASSLAWRSWNTLVPSARRALEAHWLDTSSRGTTRRRVAAPVGANPLTRREVAHTIRRGRRYLDISKRLAKHGDRDAAREARSHALGLVETAVIHGEKGTQRASKKFIGRAARTAIPNPGVRLPRPGTRLTVAEALELAQRLGNKSLVKQCHAAMRLQKASDRNTKCVVWKHLPIGSKNHLDGVVAMTHYGRSPEDMYTPPKGSKKGPHMYRHRWKKSVDVLASPSGKAIVKLMGPGQKVGDWMRG